MTLKDLSQYYQLKVLILRDEEILRNLREAIAPGGQVLTGMPHAPGVKDKVGDLAAEIADMEQHIERRKVELAEREAAVNGLIDGMDDEYLKTIFRLRFIRCLTWCQVAMIVGGGNTEHSVKTASYRYLKKMSRSDTP